MTTSILIVLTGSLGDIARALCLPAHIKGHYPESRITWLVESRWEPLLSGHPYVDRTVVFERTWRLGAIKDMLRQLRSDSCSIALDLQRILKSGLLSRASGARRRIGFHPGNAKEFNWIFNNEYIGRYDDRLPKLQHYLKFAEHLGVPAPSDLNFGLPAQKADRTAGCGSVRTPYIAIVMGSSRASKDWRLEGYAELIAGILASGSHRVVLVGDQMQATAARRLTERMNTDLVIDMVDRTSLQQLVNILACAEAAVGPDTGVGHLAAAVKTPYVTLMGPTAPERVAPYGCEHLVVKSNAPCAPCGRKNCPQPEYDCMGAIGAEAVFNMLSTALGQSSANRIKDKGKVLRGYYR